MLRGGWIIPARRRVAVCVTVACCVTLAVGVTAGRAQTGGADTSAIYLYQGADRGERLIAKALGLEIPAAVLTSADEVIE